MTESAPEVSLVSIETDTHPLDGLYYRPRGEIRAQAMILHGNCMNFYTGAPRFLPPALARLGIATLAFNRRGHDIIATLNSREATGGAFQRIDEALADSRFAEGWLRERGPAPIVIGHSNGGLLAAAHVAGRADIPALVLLSAHQGGRGMVPFASRAGLLAQDRLGEISDAARAALRDGRGDALMLLPGWWYAVTAASFVDMLDRLPDLMRLAPDVGCPTLFLAGDAEPPEQYPARAFAAAAGGPAEAQIIPDCDHFYTGRFEETTARVVAWLTPLLNGPG